MTSNNNLLGIPRCAVLVFLLAIALGIGWGQASAPDAAPPPLPPAAQEALNKGIIAAKVPDYLLAIHYFEEARKLAPDAPVVYLNMGLAESRIPGRELRAMAWFGAYLAAYPDAPNAAAVSEQIAVLSVRNQSNVFRLLKSTQDAASQLSGSDKYSALHDVAWLYAKAGDIPAALKVASLIEGTGFQRSARENIADVQAERDGLGLTRPGRLPSEEPDYYSSLVLAPSFWVAQLESDKGYTPGNALNTAPFLDLAGYLVSGHFLDVMKPKPLDIDPQQFSANDLSSHLTIFYAFKGVAKDLALAQYESDRMLKQQAAQPYIMNSSERKKKTASASKAALESSDSSMTKNTGRAKPKSGDSPADPKTSQLNEYIYEGRKVTLAPEMIFDITGKVESAGVSQDYFGSYIHVVLKDNARHALKEFSEQYIGREAGFTCNSKLVSVAVVREPISDGRLQISGGTGTMEELMKLASELSSKQASD